MKKKVFKKFLISALTMATALSMMPALPVTAQELEWVRADGKEYWYEDGVKMGVYGAPGNVWFDGTERGKEIYDPASNAWYWLDTCYDGAKAVGKEVFMPYVYGNESGMTLDEKYNIAYESNTCEENIDNAKLGFQVYHDMLNGTGKWVRYDEEGRMLKGWVTIEGPLADIYTDQVGHVYYYDQRTGIMAKGIVEIDGKHFEFDRITGVLIGETDKPTDEEDYNAKVSKDVVKNLFKVTTETVYETPRSGEHNNKIVYCFDNPDTPFDYTSVKTYTERNGAYQLTCEKEYKLFEWEQNGGRYSSNRLISAKFWSLNGDTGEYYLSIEETYQPDPDNANNNIRAVETFYRPDGIKSVDYIYDYRYDDNGKLILMTETHINYDSQGRESYTTKTETEYVYAENGNLIQVICSDKVSDDDSPDYILEMFKYFYDVNGNRVREERYINSADWLNDTYVYTLELVEAKINSYQEICGSWCNTLQESHMIADGVMTDKVLSKTVNEYDSSGRITRNLSYTLNNDEFVLTTQSEYKYDEEGYTVYYRSYFCSQEWDSYGSYTYSDPKLSYGYDNEYADIPDSTSASGTSHTLSKYVFYTDENFDGVEEISYYTNYDLEFDWDIEDLNAGDKKVKMDITYNADGSVYYTTATTYEVKSYTAGLN